MTSKILLNAIGEISDNYILEAHTEQPRTARRNKLRRKVAAITSIAASICIMFTACFYVIGRFGYFGARCGSYPGEIVNGIYYYYVPHDGIYRYTPGEQSEKLLSAFWFDFWNVNEYGLYYSYGRSLYVKPHDTGKSQKLYTSNLTNSTHISFGLLNDNALVNVHNKYTDMRSEVLVDGKSGGVIEILIEPTPSNYDFFYSDSVFISGERTLTFEGSYKYATVDLQENGVSILPEGFSVFRYPDKYGDIIVFRCYDEINGNIANIDHFFIVRPDGNDTFLTVEYDEYLGYIQGATYDGRYLFGAGSNTVNCIDTYTNEVWELSADAEHDFCDIVCDGQYLYTCAPWNDIQTCWKIIYDGDKPTAMQLVEQNIIP